MSSEKGESKPMQTKNKILIAAISAVVVVGVALGIYFGVHNKNNSNSVTPPGQNGTMINGTLFPYYTLTGPAPAPVGVAGMVYTTCKTPNTFSISFDDGPSEWTHELLDLLDKENLKVTFFVNGNNQGCIYDPKVQSILKRAFQSGHQIASHTWSHPQLTTLTVDGIKTEMTRLEEALEAVLGVVPRYMRPPFGDGTFGNGNANDVKVQTTLKGLGYVITTWDIATTDADIDDNNVPHKLSDQVLMAKEQQQVTSVVEAGAKGATHMQLMHDTYMRTIRLMAPWSINYIKNLGYKMVPVATCLGDEDPRTWYKKIGPAAASTPTTCTK
ncbi:Carbohydrate esterase 4 protein [Mortierella alpina]|uniref:Carbohydrate esterase 4 protein n=1 Tax=Mortierella alpina TaxID=64518 RepID=A0A9P6LXS9_MORAP|nr:Carbohydrate esterase 4 protein [Mortierella alpina]